MSKAIINPPGIKKGCRLFLIFFIVLTITYTLPTTTTASAESNPSSPPDPPKQTVQRNLVTIEIYEEGQDANKIAKVGPGDLRSITFNGNVLLSSDFPGKNLEQVFVTLRASIEDDDWSAMVTPPVVVFPYQDNNFVSHEESFILMILAPFRAPVSEHSITVTGEWMSSPANLAGQAEEGHVKVTVLPFPDLLLNSMDSLIETSPGSSLDFILEVRNRGNDVDDFMIEIINEDSLNRGGWSIELESSTVEDVPSWGYKNVTIRVHSPQRFTIWKNQIQEIIVRVTSLSLPGTDYEGFGTKEYPLFYYERGVYFPPEPTICSIIGIIVFIIIIVWYRRNRYNKWKKETGEEIEEETDD